MSELLEGSIPGEFLVRSPVHAFATRSSWVMLDEPEVHLFGSEAQRLGRSLSEFSESGRMIVATHSLELASMLVGKCEFLNFGAPGSIETSSPLAWDTSQIGALAGKGPGGLSSIKVLYVEGIWDQKVLQALFAKELRQHQVLISPMHGTTGASACVTSVWQRMVSAPFGVMFDNLAQAEVLPEWESMRNTLGSDRTRVVRQLRSEAERGNSNERRAILRLQANILEAKMEDRMSFVLHGLSDIFQVVSPRHFGAEGDSWSDIGLQPGESFKQFVKKRYSVDLMSGYHCQKIFDNLTRGTVACDQDSLARLRESLLPFFHCT